MDWKAFFASLVGSVAWPSVIIVALFALRNQLPGMAERLEEISFPGGAKATFKKAVDRGRIETERAVSEVPVSERTVQAPDERRRDLADRAPIAAVVETYNAVEEILIDIRAGLKLNPRSNLNVVLNNLVERKLVASSAITLFRTFRKARDAAVHTEATNPITPGEAIEYMAQGDFLLNLFRTALDAI